jgi:hypothetical protein
MSVPKISIVVGASLQEVILEFFVVCEGLYAWYGARGAYTNQVDSYEI